MTPDPGSEWTDRRLDDAFRNLNDRVTGLHRRVNGMPERVARMEATVANVAADTAECLVELKAQRADRTSGNRWVIGIMLTVLMLVVTAIGLLVQAL